MTAAAVGIVMPGVAVARRGGGQAASALPGPLPDVARWYGVCITLGMLGMLTTPDLTLLFLGVVVGLGTAFVWVLWEMEQMSRQQVSRPRRNSNRIR